VVLHRRESKAVFTGDVVVVRTGYRLTCETLTVTYGEDQRVTHLLAEGNVKVVEEGRTVTARIAEFDNIREILTLTGDAVLVEGENVIRGDRVIFHLPTDEVRVEKVRARVRMGDAGTLGSTNR
jgi:lipopolysaccharide export system protein LptA